MDYSEFNVMVVDDEEATRMFSEMVLKKHLNVSVVTAPNPPAAFELMTTKMPDLLFLDMEMPGMDGFTALKKLRSDSLTVELPVVICTAVNSSDLIRALFKLKIKDFILKPIQKDVLVEKAVKILDGLRLDRKK